MLSNKAILAVSVVWGSACESRAVPYEVALHGLAHDALEGVPRWQS